MGDIKKIDKRDNVRVVTDNSIIEASDMAKLSLNARKLFYVAVSQCRRHDQEFYEYETTAEELAKLWGVSTKDIYQVAKPICKELMQIVITLPSGRKGFQMRHLFEKCRYGDDAVLNFKLHPEMTDLLLGLRKNFSKPLVWDFMRMRSPYSMALWHYFQKEMGSYKPMMTQSIEFECDLDDLRKVTGCQNKLKPVNNFKQRVLDKALLEIKRNCWVDITYKNIKVNRVIVGFRFTAKSVWGYQDVSDMPYRMQKRMRKAELIRKRSEGVISPDETEELLDLMTDLDQMTFEDYLNDYPIE